MKIIIITCLMFLCFNSNFTEFSYKDSCNNVIVIEKTENLPKPINTKFLKENFNSRRKKNIQK